MNKVLVANTLEELEQISATFATQHGLPQKLVNDVVVCAHACGSVRTSNQYLEKLNMPFRLFVNEHGIVESKDA